MTPTARNPVSVSTLARGATLAVAAAFVTALAVPAPAVADDVLVLEWEDLMPPGEEAILDQLYDEYFAELERRMRQDRGMNLNMFDSLSSFDAVEEGGEFDTMEQIGTFNVVEALDGRTVRIPGFVVPFDFRADDVYEEFLFVPYFGACIHYPPPPPNQIVYVRLDRPGIIRDIYRPFWIEGVMTTQRNENELGDAAYTLTLSDIEPYEG